MRPKTIMYIKRLTSGQIMAHIEPNTEPAKRSEKSRWVSCQISAIFKVTFKPEIKSQKSRVLHILAMRVSVVSNGNTMAYIN